MGQIPSQSVGETLCYLFHRNKSSQSERLLWLPFFTHMPRAARSSKSTLGAVKLGQLLHRLVSKPCYMSLRGSVWYFNGGDRSISADKQEALISLHHPQLGSNRNHLSESTPSPALLSQHLPVSNQCHNVDLLRWVFKMLWSFFLLSVNQLEQFVFDFMDPCFWVTWPNNIELEIVC